MALVQSVSGRSITAVEPAVEAPLIVVEQAQVEPPPRAAIAAMTWPISERQEIKQRVADFKAHQLKMQNEREGYYLKTMSRTRAIIETTRHLVR